MDIYGLINICLQVSACLVCYTAGKQNGARELIDTLVTKRMITANDIKKIDSNS